MSNVEREAFEKWWRDAESADGTFYGDTPMGHAYSGWLAHARASRPREAGTVCHPGTNIPNHQAWLDGEKAPPVAPEACPRCGSKVSGARRFTVREMGGGMFMTVPCDHPFHAQPASAPAEGGKYVPKVGDVVRFKTGEYPGVEVLIHRVDSNGYTWGYEVGSNQQSEYGRPDAASVYEYVRPATDDERKAAGIATPAPSAAAPTVAEVEECARVLYQSMECGPIETDPMVNGLPRWWNESRPSKRDAYRAAARALLAHLGKGAK